MSLPSCPQSQQEHAEVWKFLADCTRLQELMRMREEIIAIAARTPTGDPAAFIAALAPRCAAWRGACVQFLGTMAPTTGAWHQAPKSAPKSPGSTTASCAASAAWSPSSAAACGQEEVHHPLELLDGLGFGSPSGPEGAPDGFAVTPVGTATGSPDAAKALPSGAPEPPPGVCPPGMPTIGSQLHGSGRCKPCAFFHTKGCTSGEECQFCHLCDDQEKRRRQQVRCEARRSRARHDRVSAARAPDCKA